MKHLALAVLLTVAVAGTTPALAHDHAGSGKVLGAEQQKALSPDQALADLKHGNENFVAGRLTDYDYLAQARTSAAEGQYPRAAVLSCLDSRVPVELVFDQGIGDVFVGRVAGNFENVDMLGSLEFATAASGVPLIVVLGHSDCGAVKGALKDVQLGNLTPMLDNFDEAMAQVRAEHGEAPMAELVAATVEANVHRTVDDIVQRSPVIAELVQKGEVKVVGAVYDLATGKVTWLDRPSS